ncbi:MAG: xanthine phosphoribosyltransferase [Chloroflexi bacterium]|nr:xanthine phosphoribosyltransferase [Chloroflexota bacterium]
MDELKRRVLAEGKNLGDGILKVDSILNHQMDPQLMYEIGQEIARRFEAQQATRILTAEVSGIGPALMTGLALGIPIVYARKRKPITMMEPVHVESAPSHTKGHETLLMVSPEFLMPQDRVLIVDDFLATGKTIAALGRLVKRAGAQLVGVGAVIEKTFEGGRDYLSDFDGLPIESLVVITDMPDHRIILAD